MELEGYVDQVRQQLTAAAALGDERVQQVAGALGDAADAALRFALLGAVSEAADEITAQLLDYPLSPAVAVRLDGTELRAQVEPTAGHAPAAEPAAVDGEASARISLRLSEALKERIDEAAARAGVSVNTWLVRAASSALEPAPRSGFSVSTSAHRITGYING